ASMVTREGLYRGRFFVFRKTDQNKGEIMTYIHSRIRAAFIARFFVLLFVLGCAQMAMAQSTIFNIPSTDTVSAKKGYAEFDYLAQVPGPDGGGRFQILVPRVVVGVAPNLE